MSEPFDVETLPPTQYLIIETLAARHRLGEHVWPLPRNRAMTNALGHLEMLGLVSYERDFTPESWRCRLTYAGREAAFDAQYVPPILRDQSQRRRRPRAAGKQQPEIIDEDAKSGACGMTEVDDGGRMNTWRSTRPQIRVHVAASSRPSTRPASSVRTDVPSRKVASPAASCRCDLDGRRCGGLDVGEDGLCAWCQAEHGMWLAAADEADAARLPASATARLPASAESAMTEEPR